MKLDKAKLSLFTMAGIIGVQLIGIFILSGISMAKNGEIILPTEMWDMVKTTLALFSGVAGSMYFNGRVKNGGSTGKT